jgi:uncharacterized protein YfbU (UPF0304 family)
MTLSKKDRLLLINQYKILAALDKSEESHYLELIEILERGYSIFYSMIDEWVSEDMPEGEGRFVLEILDLYRAIEDVKRSSKDSRVIGHTYGVFPGFDGNNESEYLGLCRFLIEKQGKFQEQMQYLQKNDGMNSHMPMVKKYRRMLDEKLTISSPDSWRLTVEQVLKVLDA